MIKLLTLIKLSYLSYKLVVNKKYNLTQFKIS